MHASTSVIILYFFVVFPNQNYVFHPNGSVANTMVTVVISVAVSQWATYDKYDVRIYQITPHGDNFHHLAPLLHISK